MIRALRWLLVAPMAALGWIIAFTDALATHSLIDTYCPEQYKVSNACTWEWATFTQERRFWWAYLLLHGRFCKRAPCPRSLARVLVD